MFVRFSRINLWWSYMTAGDPSWPWSNQQGTFTQQYARYGIPLDHPARDIGPTNVYNLTCVNFKWPPTPTKSNRLLNSMCSIYVLIIGFLKLPFTRYRVYEVDPWSSHITRDLRLNDRCLVFNKGHSHVKGVFQPKFNNTLNMIFSVLGKQ